MVDQLDQDLTQINFVHPLVKPLEDDFKNEAEQTEIIQKNIPDRFFDPC